MDARDTCRLQLIDLRRVLHESRVSNDNPMDELRIEMDIRRLSRELRWLEACDGEQSPARFR
jgi:hypothetical protein